MRIGWTLPICFGLILITKSESDGKELAKILLQKMNLNLLQDGQKLTKAEWNFENNRTEANLQNLVRIGDKVAARFRKALELLDKYSWGKVKDERLEQRFKTLFTTLPLENQGKLQRIRLSAENVEWNTTICDFYDRTKCDLGLRQGLRERWSNSENVDELEYLWREWRNASGLPLRKLFLEYKELLNLAASSNNGSDFEKYFPNSNAFAELKDLWRNLTPFYLQLHAYVRRRLRETYGEEIVPRRGAIPSYLLGNLQGENWSGIFRIVIPYPDEDKVNFTSVMIKKGYTPYRMYREAENFFSSLNFSGLSQHFWNDSIITSTLDCRPKLFNFYVPNKVRVKHCAKVSIEDLLTAHRLVAKSQYVLQNSRQSFVYQQLSNTALEEAVSEAITLSVSTFDHLTKLQLLTKQDTMQFHINRLLKLALEKITAIPYYMIHIFWKRRMEEDMDCEWRKLSEEYQGILIPEPKSALSFDPGGVENIFSERSAIRHLVSSIMQFQIYSSLCNTSEKFHSKNKYLEECDIYGSASSGKALRRIFLEATRPWPTVMKIATGQRQLNTDSLLEFFEPLIGWLKRENDITGEEIGWTSSVTSCPALTIEEKNEPRRRSKRDLSQEEVKKAKREDCNVAVRKRRYVKKPQPLNKRRKKSWTIKKIQKNKKNDPSFVEPSERKVSLKKDRPARRRTGKRRIFARRKFKRGEKLIRKSRKIPASELDDDYEESIAGSKGFGSAGGAAAQRQHKNHKKDISRLIHSLSMSRNDEQGKVAFDQNQMADNSEHNKREQTRQGFDSEKRLGAIGDQKNTIENILNDINYIQSGQKGAEMDSKLRENYEKVVDNNAKSGVVCGSPAGGMISNPRKEPIQGTLVLNLQEISGNMMLPTSRREFDKKGNSFKVGSFELDPYALAPVLRTFEGENCNPNSVLQPKTIAEEKSKDVAEEPNRGQTNVKANPMSEFKTSNEVAPLLIILGDNPTDSKDQIIKTLPLQINNQDPQQRNDPPRTLNQRKVQRAAKNVIFLPLNLRTGFKHDYGDSSKPTNRVVYLIDDKGGQASPLHAGQTRSASDYLASWLKEKTNLPIARVRKKRAHAVDPRELENYKIVKIVPLSETDWQNVMNFPVGLDEHESDDDILIEEAQNEGPFVMNLKKSSLKDDGVPWVISGRHSNQFKDALDSINTDVRCDTCGKKNRTALVDADFLKRFASNLRNCDIKIAKSQKPQNRLVILLLFNRNQNNEDEDEQTSEEDEEEEYNNSGDGDDQLQLQFLQPQQQQEQREQQQQPQLSPLDTFALINQILQKLQCKTEEPKYQLTEEDPDYPSNDNFDQLKLEQPQSEPRRYQTPFSGRSPMTVDQLLTALNNNDDDRRKVKTSPAVDQLTLFNNRKLVPVIIELRKVDEKRKTGR